ncbi:putative nicotinate-nucleotide adenylyltransferase [Nitrospina gracilis 3/211]|uniref:Probable nicotinate-nucleotide adenylyltransferase n=1 Tax=Nitrospina gracilis (strain 3/211) TaxID=1266370 RepID=M1YX21_NITG3|nr:MULTISPECIES: nicotinate-nucleotide adenylyltransferase [Nitrospina]MCF8723164.1 nicotinate-nucleotide adenylyltransferase [Nitrospina sp. Nb-3]CCQ90207.1 putative nicotinate-nucleotide adenylyltransferase [Nitrospina gracilis 3/211]
MNTPSHEQIGILGGSFDPVHNGHLGLAREARATFSLDRVLFIPAAIPPHKRDRDITPTHHRLEMLRRALENENGFEISEIEIERGGVSYTRDTLEELQSRWPNAQISLIMGADTFRDFSTWKQYDRVLKASHILVASRPGHTLDEAAEDMKTLISDLPFSYRPEDSDHTRRTFFCRQTGRRIALFPIPPEAVSSTEIRDALRRGDAVKKMLPPAVSGYIMTHRLYQAHPHPMS